MILQLKTWLLNSKNLQGGTLEDSSQLPCSGLFNFCMCKVFRHRVCQHGFRAKNNFLTGMKWFSRISIFDEKQECRTDSPILISVCTTITSRNLPSLVKDGVSLWIIKSSTKYRVYLNQHFSSIAHYVLFFNRTSRYTAHFFYQDTETFLPRNMGFSCKGQW